MRFRLVGIIVLCTVSLFAQDDKQPYYIQAPQSNIPETSLDCYQYKLEQGLTAQKRGDCRMALRWFRDAQNCPEALKISERQEEIKTLIEKCEGSQPATATAPKQIKKTSTPQPSITIPSGSIVEIRRRFRPSREFLRFNKPQCFDITCKEAARAFSGGYWDDATALYRAAKNCSDADQSDRLYANRRIKACRAASENELRKKEQEAIRQARHALATNRANYSRQLLRNYDRSLAYRLADFANEYIAPEDNDACRQSMFDALYYAPAIHSGTSNRHMQIPFCYQLGDNLDKDLQVCFLEQKKKPKICAFAQSRHMLFQWDANSFEPSVPISMEDTTLQHMDAVPDGRTLLFRSPNAYLFWRSPREIFRLPANVHLYCFSPSGNTFYYLNPSERSIYALDLREAFATRKGASRATPKALGIGVSSDILSLAAGDQELWLGYQNGVAVYSPGTSDLNQWNLKQAYQLGYRVPDYKHGGPPKLWLDPASQSAVFTNDTAAIIFNIRDTGTLMPSRRLVGNALAVGANTQFVATYQANLYGNDSRLYIFRTDDGWLKYGALVPTGRANMHLNSGAFSPDNRMFATTTSNGRLEIWMLDDGPNQKIVELGPCKFVAQNTAGTQLFLWRNDSLLSVSTDQPGKALQHTSAPSQADLPYILAGQNWVCYRTGRDSILLTDQLGRKHFTIASPQGTFTEIAGAFSPDEEKFAVLAGDDSVAVYSLKTGAVLASRAFGGTINQLHFVPQTGEVLVVHLVESDNLNFDQTVIKLWDPAKTASTKMRTVRLQGYETREVTFAEHQGFIAFTDGLDIRVFRQDDLLNEIIRIRQNGTHMVTAMGFHPDGKILAAGYEDGSIIFWDVESGQSRFTWTQPPGETNQGYTSIVRLKFIEGGRRLQILFLGSKLLIRDLEVSLIRAGVQTDFQKLISFQPSQIREYNLEEALDYPNNFSRLAASGDLPLIRSFFDYFRETAVYSNNIQRVGNSCNRAAILYGQLDSSTQYVLRPILQEVFDDYHWKLLLRNQIGAAQKVAKAMKRDFGSSAAAIRAAAHTALLRGDKRAAAQQYAEWALRSADRGSGQGFINRRSLDSLQNKIRQLLEYDLIKPDQLDCLCDLFQNFSSFQQLCAALPERPGSSLLTSEMQLRWRIFQQLNTSQSVQNKRQKAQMLEAVLADTRKLPRRNTAMYQREQEKVILALSAAYTDLGIFEQSTPLALDYYQKSIAYLNQNGPFKHPTRERNRLLSLTQNYLQIGEANQNRDKLLEAQNAYRQGFLEANRLLELVQTDPPLQQKYRDELRGLLAVRMGTTYLLQGNAETALKAFEEAQNDRTEGIHRLYFGHAALLADNEIKALLEYGNIYTDEKLGQALFDIEQMAIHLPSQRRRLLGFLHRMRAARLQTREQMDSIAVDYYWAYQKIYAAANLGKWDSALHWSTVATQLAALTFQPPKAPGLKHNHWLDALLNQSYYLLFRGTRDTARLAQVIRLSTEAQLYFDTSTTLQYYQYKALVKTNLAHAYWLRQQVGDPELAVQIYKDFLESGYAGFDTWELLFKDFRDLHKAGVLWPDLPKLIQQIRPEAVVLTPEDWKAIGIETPPE